MIHQLNLTIPRPVNQDDVRQIFLEQFGLVVDPQAILQVKGRAGHPFLYSWKQNGSEMIAISTDNRVGSTSHCRNTTRIIIHGAACDLELFEPVHLFRWILSEKGWCSEIHLAADDHGRILAFDDLLTLADTDPGEPDPSDPAYTGEGSWQKRIVSEFVCRRSFSKKLKKDVYNRPTRWKQHGHTLEFPSGTRRVQIYDTRGPVRCEIQLKKKGPSTDILTRIAAGESIHSLTLGTLAATLTINERSKKSYKYGGKVAAYWQEFLDSTEPVKLDSKGKSAHKSPWRVTKTISEIQTDRITSVLGQCETHEEAVTLARGMMHTMQRVLTSEVFQGLLEKEFNHVGRIIEREVRVPGPQTYIYEDGSEITF
jgi:hypothetical protein